MLGSKRADDPSSFTPEGRGSHCRRMLAESQTGGEFRGGGDEDLLAMDMVVMVIVRRANRRLTDSRITVRVNGGGTASATIMRGRPSKETDPIATKGYSGVSQSDAARNHKPRAAFGVAAASP